MFFALFDGAILSDARIKANRVLRFYVAFVPVFRLYRRFCIAKIAKTRKTGKFSRFRENVAQKTSGLFVQFDGWTVPRRAYTLYIYRAARPALAIKKFNRFPLCYYYIASMRFCQAFQESFTFPNMTDCTNTKRMVHSKRPGHSKHSRQPSRRFFRRRPYIPAPES